MDTSEDVHTVDESMMDTVHTRGWPRPILDLNAGPGTVDLEVRDSK